MTNIYKIDKFNLSSIINTRSIAIIGRSKSGKTTLIKDIINHQKMAQNIVIDPILSYNDIIPKEFIHQEYDPTFIEHIMEIQKNRYKNSMTNKDVQLIIDNCDLNFDDITLKQLFLNYRFCKINLLFSLQTIQYLNPTIGKNIDYLFIYPSSTNDMKLIYKTVSNLFESYEHFYTIVNQCTQNNYECLVIDYTKQSDNIIDKIFWYRAEIDNSNRYIEDEDISNCTLPNAFNIFRNVFCL
jgi:ABC-type dipeptide/oligopeptide/nickel transport system ATPase component